MQNMQTATYGEEESSYLQKITEAMNSFNASLGPIPTMAWRGVKRADGTVKPFTVNDLKDLYTFTEGRSFVCPSVRLALKPDDPYSLVVKQLKGLENGPYMLWWRDAGVGQEVRYISFTLEASILAPYDRATLQRLVELSDEGKADLKALKEAKW